MTHIVILAQGSQSRLPNLSTPKQLLPLPGCGNAQILERTLRQLTKMKVAASVTIVAEPSLFKQLHGFRSDIGVVDLVTLRDPGNSSLKGLARYFAQVSERLDVTRPDSSLVLFGDCVYSWRCLRALLDVSDDGAGAMTFVGTKTLSRSDGELWGCSWMRSIEPQMLSALRRALEHHPPAQVDNVYQPGQMRRLLWEIDASYQWMFGTPGKVYDQNARWWFTPVDDYTMDIDTPDQIPMLKAISAAAALDDKEHGLTW